MHAAIDPLCKQWLLASLLTLLCCLQVKPKRIRPVVEQRPLTQDELLAEAAHTELDNLRDLEQMVALEEATKKKAMYKRSKYSGPMIRFHSKKVGEVALVSTACSLTEGAYAHVGRPMTLESSKQFGVLGHHL